MNEHLALAVRMAWAALDDGARADEPRSTSWRDVRFIGEYDGRIVDGPTAAAPIEWQRAALRALRAGELPRSCLPVRYRGETWTGVHPSRIDWTGYRHAGGDPARRSRSGPSGPTKSEDKRTGEQVKLRLSADDANELRELASARGVTVSALVADLVRAARR